MHFCLEIFICLGIYDGVTQYTLLSEDPVLYAKYAPTVYCMFLSAKDVHAWYIFADKTGCSNHNT